MMTVAEMRRVWEHLEAGTRPVIAADVAWFWSQVAQAACAAAFDRVLREEFSSDLDDWYTGAPGTNLLRDIEGEVCGCRSEKP